MPSILELIENKDLDIDQTEYYAAILGESPSKGAKSPSLWNAAFNGLDLSGMMHPMDVKPDRLLEVVQGLRDDRRFIGGAVTMPYKISILPHLDTIEPEAEMIGAVNCIYRDREKLIGSNTDGAGALWSLAKAMPDGLSGKTALLLGTGGAGFAVASYLASALGQQGYLKLSNRSTKPRDELVQRVKGKCIIEPVDWPISPEDVEGIDILVNCTSIGFETMKKDDKGLFSLKYFTPLGYTKNDIRVKGVESAEKHYLKKASDEINENIRMSLDILASMNSPLIFDIIYQPFRTLLLSLAELTGCKSLNGAPMNLEQAVIAFRKAVSVSGLSKAENDEIRGLMKNVW